MRRALLVVALVAWGDARSAQADDLAITATVADGNVEPGGRTEVTLTVTNTGKGEVVVGADSSSQANVWAIDAQGHQLGLDGQPPRPTPRCRRRLEAIEVQGVTSEQAPTHVDVHLAPGEAHSWTGTFVARRYRWDRHACPPSPSPSGAKLRPRRYHLAVSVLGASTLATTVDVEVAR